MPYNYPNEDLNSEPTTLTDNHSMEDYWFTMIFITKGGHITIKWNDDQPGLFIPEYDDG